MKRTYSPYKLSLLTIGIFVAAGSVYGAMKNAEPEQHAGADVYPAPLVAAAPVPPAPIQIETAAKEATTTVETSEPETAVPREQKRAATDQATRAPVQSTIKITATQQTSGSKSRPVAVAAPTRPTNTQAAPTERSPQSNAPARTTSGRSVRASQSSPAPSVQESRDSTTTGETAPAPSKQVAAAPAPAPKPPVEPKAAPTAAPSEQKDPIVAGAIVATPRATPAPAPKPAPTTTTVASGNPLAGHRLYVDQNTDAKRQADAWRNSRPDDARQMDKIAQRSQVIWLGNWISNIESETRTHTERAKAAGTLPVFMLYNIPNRDCGSYSAGGSANKDSYLDWIRGFLRGVGDSKAAVLLEADVLAQFDCLSPDARNERISMLKETVALVSAKPALSLYIDAGHSKWHTPGEIAARLRSVDVARTQGFVLNVSNFQTTADSIRYGSEISGQIGGKHFVIDTSRNGNGPATDNAWCNPRGRALGERPTTVTNHALVDAYLWVKVPGQSDGECNGGPRAGAWWPEYALELAKNAAF